MNDMNGEMMLMLDPRQGALLHSLSFAKPALVSSSTWRSSTGEELESAIGAKQFPNSPLDGTSEAAVAHQLRSTMRHLMKNTR